MGYWRRRRSWNSAATARNIELRISMNIPATPSRNKGLADRNIIGDHRRLESCTKTDGRPRAEGPYRVTILRIWHPNHWTMVQPMP
jgi:hypothetical protein